jgi:hypothetical protein
MLQALFDFFFVASSGESKESKNFHEESVAQVQGTTLTPTINCMCRGHQYSH